MAELQVPALSKSPGAAANPPATASSKPASLPEAYRTIAVHHGASMDPGNWATDLGGGSRFGYSLLSVVLLSSLIAMFLQGLSAKLGIASGRDLAQACRERYSPRVRISLWLLCEVAIVACDLAEVLGSAVALKLLFNLPLLAGVMLTGLDVLIVLALQSRGFRWIEALVVALIATVGACFAYEIFFAQPLWRDAARGLIPTVDLLRNREMLYLSIGILGATVMPNNLYLHSSVVQTRAFGREVDEKRDAIRYAILDSTVALVFAFCINASILVLGAAVFHTRGLTSVADISQAYQLLTPAVGVGLASTLFAAALLCSGQNSTLTGTLAGQIVMEGFLHLRLQPWLRRLLTRSLAIVPAALVIGIAGERKVTGLLILSQVILSFQLPFAIVPLVQFTSDRRQMGEFANSRWVAAAAWMVAAAVIALNGLLLVLIFRGQT